MSLILFNLSLIEIQNKINNKISVNQNKEN